MKKSMVVLAMFVIPAQAFAAWDTLTTKVDAIYGSWNSSNSSTVNEVCIRFTNNEIAMLDLTKPADEVNYVNLLAAKAQNSDVTVYLEIGGILTGGCNTGTSLRRHGIIMVNR